MRSDLLKFPDSAPRSLEIAAECFISSNTLDDALDCFSSFVYSDVVSMNNSSDMHIFKEFVFLN